LAGRIAPDDPRTPGQRRADALIQLCRQRLDEGTLPELGGERPHLTVVVPITALAAGVPHPAAPPVFAAGVPDHPATPPAFAGRAAAPASVGVPGPARWPTAPAPAPWSAPGGPTHERMTAEATWGAVLGPPALRRLSCDASLARVVLAADSQPLDVGRRSRTVPAAIRTALVVRDGGCVFPGCDRPPPWTDAHHVVHWADGGPTSLGNLALLCRSHHRTVHEGQWRLTRDPGGRWTAGPPLRAGPAPPPTAAAHRKP
jgi:hypothetical protein